MGLQVFKTPPDNKEQPSELTPCNSRERVYEGGAPLERQERAQRRPSWEEISPSPPRRLIHQVNPHRVPRSSARPPVRARERQLNATSSSSSADDNPEPSSWLHSSSSLRLVREEEYPAASRLASLHRNGESPPPLEDVPEPYNPRRPLLTEASLSGNMNDGDSSHLGPDYTFRRDPRWVSGLGAGGDEEEETAMIPNRPITTEGLTSAFNGLPRRDPVLLSHPYLFHMRSRHPLQRTNPAVTVSPPLESRALESPSPEPQSLSEDGSFNYARMARSSILNGFGSEALSPTEVMEGISPETMQAISRPISPVTLQNPFQLSGIPGSHWNGTPDDDSSTYESIQMPLRSSAMSDITPTAEHFEHRDQAPEALDCAEYNRLRPVYASIIWTWARALRAAGARSNDPFVGPVPLDQKFYELFDDLISEDLNRVEPAVGIITHLIILYRNQWSSIPETEANLFIGARFRDVLHRNGLQRERSLWEDCIGFHLDRNRVLTTIEAGSPPAV
jgi:hypothetical protein